jgi:hypothetical protein
MFRDLLTELSGPAASATTSKPTNSRVLPYALSAAGNLPSKAAVRRLVAVTLVGLRPPS